MNNSDAQYEALRHKRNKKALDTLIHAKPGKALDTPGWRRWNKTMMQIEAVLIQMETEMEEYHQQRSKHWRNKSKNAYILFERLKQLKDIMDAVTGWLDYDPLDSVRYENSVTLRKWCADNAVKLDRKWEEDV